VCDKVVRLAKRAGVKLTSHSLRKGFGCRYAGKVPAQVLQRLMRHARISTTMAYYANVDEAVLEAVLGPRRNN
jgi:integrase